jgi:formylglycine-generating enzyme required for sulfatase activity
MNLRLIPAPGIRPLRTNEKEDPMAQRTPARRAVRFVFCAAVVLLLVDPPAARGGSDDLQYLELATRDGLTVRSYQVSTGEVFTLLSSRPLFSVRVDNVLVSTLGARVSQDRDLIVVRLTDDISGRFRVGRRSDRGWRIDLVLENGSKKPVVLENLVPFGEDPRNIFITGYGPPALARAGLFRPGKKPVSVILPDNAWELGYGSVERPGSRSLCGLARRGKGVKAELRRYRTVLEPGGTVEYTVYADVYDGAWQEGLRVMFHGRRLFDLDTFDRALYERPDLAWIRRSFVMVLQMAWDKEFFDRGSGRYEFERFLEKCRALLGGCDVFGVWPTWPRLGLDDRNQWDLYRDLPGGLGKIRELADLAHKQGTKFFVAYNPWDTDTRRERPFEGMAGLIRALDADGVVLDTMGGSTKDAQKAADAVKPGVVMYSEGMPVPQDMPDIVASRVHDALVVSPVLNLNRLIEPEFAIFRVAQLADGELHREIAVAFFNGYGVELNAFKAGRPDWVEPDLRTLGRAAMILRDNASALDTPAWTPLVRTLKDGVWVNEWPADGKTVYTVYSEEPAGFEGPLFVVRTGGGAHFVDIWNHTEVEPVVVDGESFVPASLAPYPASASGTRREGAIGCIGRFEKALQAEIDGGSLRLKSSGGDTIRIWRGNPSYEKTPATVGSGEWSLALAGLLGSYRGKIVIQLMAGTELLDERVLSIEPGTPLRTSPAERTEPAAAAPAGMVEIPGADYEFRVKKADTFIPLPDFSKPRMVRIERFFMDARPVTNLEFKKFVDETGYRPADAANFLKHWTGGKFPAGQADVPVVHVSPEDAGAYAKWAGKRLPTEIEWQYAAQGTDGRTWPWGKTFAKGSCNDSLGRPTPVNAFPRGKSPFGVLDLVGNVWQMTADVYDTGSYTYIVIRGGSFWNPTSSQWYLKGGPQPLDEHQMLLLVSPGFDRSPNVGFRCVKDAPPRNR